MKNSDLYDLGPVEFPLEINETTIHRFCCTKCTASAYHKGYWHGIGVMLAAAFFWGVIQGIWQAIQNHH